MNERKAGAVLQYLQMILSMLISLLYTPVMIRTLGQGEYGIYNLASSIISYLSLLSLGFGASYIHFYTKTKNKGSDNEIRRLNGMFMAVFVFIAIVALFAGLVLAFNVDKFFTADGYTAEDMRIAKILMIFLSVNLATSFPASVFTSYITSQEKFVFQKLVNMGKTVLSPMLTLPMLLLGFGSIGMVVITTIITFIIDIINVLYCLIKLKMKFSFKQFPYGLLKEIAVFSIFIAINQIVDQINWSVGKIILAKLMSKEAVAIYAVAATINTMYMSVSTAVSSVFTPQIHRLVINKADDSDQQLNALFVKVGRVQYAIVMLILTGFVFFGQYFILIWAGSEYLQAYYLTLLLIVPCTIALIQNVGIEIQRAKNKHRFRSYVYLAMAIINIIASVVLCYAFGIIGVAIGTAVSLILVNGIAMNIYYHVVLKINVLEFWKQILRMSLGMVIPILFGIYAFACIDIANNIQFLLLIAIYTIVYGVSMWFLGFNDYEKSLLASPIKKVIRRIKNKHAFFK